MRLDYSRLDTCYRIFGTLLSFSQSRAFLLGSTGKFREVSAGLSKSSVVGTMPRKLASGRLKEPVRFTNEGGDQWHPIRDPDGVPSGSESSAGFLEELLRFLYLQCPRA